MDKPTGVTAGAGDGSLARGRRGDDVTGGGSARMRFG